MKSPMLPTIAAHMHRRGRRFILLFACIHHTLSALVLLIWIFIYLTLSESHLNVTQMYAPKYSALSFLIVLLLHIYGVSRMCSCSRRQSKKVAPVSIIQRLNFAQEYKLAFYHTVTVACQSYQAYSMSFHIVDLSIVHAYTLLVSLYCFITPWFLVANVSYSRTLLVGFVNCFLSFIFSTGFSLFVFVIPALVFIFINPKLFLNLAWISKTVLMYRYLAVSSPIDLITRFCMNLSSFYSVTKLVAFVNSTPHLQRKNSGRELSHQTHRFLKVFLVVNLAYGLIVVGIAMSLKYFRSPCPNYCTHEVAPWFNSSCNCIHAIINCPVLGHPGDIVDGLIDPRIIGNSLFIMDLRRCPIPQGINRTLLGEFKQLFGIMVEYSSMTEWNGSRLPDTMSFLHIRYSALTKVPEIMYEIPPNMIYLSLTYSPVNTIPESLVWKSLLQVSLSGLNLTEPPLFLSSIPGLDSIMLGSNRIASVPMSWQEKIISSLPHLDYIDLSDNELSEVPIALALASINLQLSSNNITSIPIEISTEMLQKRSIALDDTPYCGAGYAFCRTQCNPRCLNLSRGNYYCDQVCMTPACRYDNGDCDGFWPNNE